MIKPVARPILSFDVRKIGAFGWNERPVRCVLGAVGDPGLQQLDFLDRELLFGLRRRHTLVGIVMGDA